ncbi:hypothetical protein ACJMK2_035127, partial [Sinanodonta woodiana]
ISKTVRLYILDVCDESPQFDRPSYVLEIEEIFNDTHVFPIDTMERRLVYNEIHATDNDNGNYAVVTYSMEPNTEDTCNLTAMPVNLAIRVKDVQDKPPFFIGLPYMRIIPEDNYTNLPLLRVEAFDGDLGVPNKINYSLNN